MMTIEHQQISVEGRTVHIASAGNRSNQSILFLHGYPENWKAFEGVMDKLRNNYYVSAIDLPGIGSSDHIASSDKRSIARFINAIADKLALGKIILAGHDVGGMTTYAFLRLFPERISKAIILNTAIPGVEPWEEVKRNPYIWHFAFYAVPSLPEALLSGKQRLLFEYFYNTLAADKNAISESNREVYAASYMNPTSLTTSFDWYRTFPQDEKDNADKIRVDLPVLYIRGDKDYGKIDQYLDGFKKAGLTNVTGKLIERCGHFAPEEQPAAVAKSIHDFISS